MNLTLAKVALLGLVFAPVSFAKTPEPSDADNAFLEMISSQNVIEQTFGMYIVDVQLESQATGQTPEQIIAAEEARSEANIDAIMMSQEDLFAQENPSCKDIRNGINESIHHVESTGSYFALLAMIVAAETRYCPQTDVLNLDHWTMALEPVQKRVVLKMPAYMAQTKSQLQKYSAAQYLNDAPEWVVKHVIPHVEAEENQNDLPSLIED